MLLSCAVYRMLTLTYSIAFIAKPLELNQLSTSARSVVVCAAKGPRPRYPRVWKTQKKIGTISKAAKLVECVKGLSNIKEEVYGALDSFIAWDLEFPLIVVKKALRTLEHEKEWKRIIQLTKWMLSKGQGRTMGTYLTLMGALVEDDRLDEAEELWRKIFTENMESTPRSFFDKMVSVYYKRGMHEKLFEIFADMDELGIRPTVPVVNTVGSVFQELGMTDKYQKLMKKYPPPKWEYRYYKGKRVRVPVKRLYQRNSANQVALTEYATKESTSEVDESDSADGGLNEVQVHNLEGSKDEVTDNNPSEVRVEASESEVRYNDSSDEHEGDTEGGEARKVEENNTNSTDPYID